MAPRSRWLLNSWGPPGGPHTTSGTPGDHPVAPGSASWGPPGGPHTSGRMGASWGPGAPLGYLPRHRLYIRAPLCSSNCRDYKVRVNVLATLLRSRTDCAPCTRARTQRHKSTNSAHPTEKPEANTGPLEGGGELGGAPGRIYAIAPFYAQACKARALYIAHFAFSHPLRAPYARHFRHVPSTPSQVGPARGQRRAWHQPYRAHISTPN